MSYCQFSNLFVFIFHFAVEQVSPQEIVAIYESSCLKNNTIEVKNIKTQLSVS